MSPREIDALVAEKVMGFTLCKCTDEEIEKWRSGYCAKENEGAIGFYVDPPRRFGSDKTCNKCGKYYVPILSYSTSIEAAWSVVEKMMINRFEDVNIDADSPNEWRVAFTDYIEKAGVAEAKTAPLAICLAALKAVGVEI